MPAQNTDLVAIERSGVLYKATASEIAGLGGSGGATMPNPNGGRIYMSGKMYLRGN
jgi:hypothetical protein